MSDDVREQRAAGLKGERRSVPLGDALRLDLPYLAELRAEPAGEDDPRVRLEGYASVTGRAYEMWDFFGPYTEKVASGAFDKTLAAKPDVNFVVNHGGLSMARTTNDSLKLRADLIGLRTEALLNPKRSDVSDLLTAIDDELVTEMSFKFRITDGEWNESYDEFTILEVDLHRGDVSAVNYGANPFTSLAAEARSFMRSLDRVPASVARAALERLSARADLGVSEFARAGIAVVDRRAALEAEAAPAPTATGRSIALIQAQLLADEG